MGNEIMLWESFGVWVGVLYLAWRSFELLCRYHFKELLNG